MKPYLDKIEVGKKELVNLFKSDDKLSIVVGIITLSLVLYLIFGLKLNQTNTMIVKEILKFCVIYLIIARLNSFSMYLIGSSSSLLIKSSLIMLGLFAISVFFKYIYETKPKEEL